MLNKTTESIQYRLTKKIKKPFSVNLTNKIIINSRDIN